MRNNKINNTYLFSALFFLFIQLIITQVKSQNMRTYNILDYGAERSESILSTSSIQKAIDECSQNGGGIVLIPHGKFVTGTIFLKQNVNLHLAADAYLLGPEKLTDYSDSIHVPVEAPRFKKCMIFAENTNHISITGSGTIDGRGSKENFPHTKKGERPMHIRFVNCDDILIQGVTIKNSASWSTHLILCERVIIEGIFLYNKMQGNNDGVDFDSCKDVFISNSKFNTNDDAICGKSTTDVTVENIVVTNCILQSECAGFKLGTSSKGTYRNITVSNCIMRDITRGAIKLICVDGGTIENVNISDIVMDNVEGPVFIRLGGRGKTYKEAKTQDYSKEGVDAIEDTPIGKIRNISISNIRAIVGGKGKHQSGVMITGIPGHDIENVHLSNIHIEFPGGGTKEQASREVPEDIKRYPEQSFFGTLPSYGIYVRHAKGIMFHDWHIRYRGTEERPAIVLNDVKESEFDLMRVMSPSGHEPLIKAFDSDKLYTNNIRSINNGSIEIQTIKSK